MTRKLKTMFTVWLALVAFGAVAASAHAEDEFHCSVVPCRLRFNADGTGKTAHQVFIFKNAAETESVSLTCERITGEATSATKTASEVTLTNITYPNCSVNGSPGMVIDMNGCDYLFTGAGGRTDAAGVHIECPAGQKIEWTIPGGCTFSIGAQRLTGAGYHTVNSPPSREITLTMNLAGIAVTANSTCASLINPNQTLTGFYTTGNAIATAETDPSEVMAEAWYE